MAVFSSRTGYRFARTVFLALASAAAFAPDPALAELFARVPAAREMAVCGDTLFVGTKGSSVYAVPLSGGRARRVASGFSAPNGVACSRGRLFVASRDRVTAFEIGRGALWAAGATFDMDYRIREPTVFATSPSAPIPGFMSRWDRPATSVCREACKARSSA